MELNRDPKLLTYANEKLQAIPGKGLDLTAQQTELLKLIPINTEVRGEVCKGLITGIDRSSRPIAMQIHNGELRWLEIHEATITGLTPEVAARLSLELLPTQPMVFNKFPAETRSVTSIVGDVTIKLLYDTADIYNLGLADGIAHANPHLPAILAELERAKIKHPQWPTDVVKMVAFMSEEAGESVRAANNYDEGGSLADLKTELVQTAAMCLRCLENLPNEKL